MSDARHSSSATSGRRRSRDAMVGAFVVESEIGKGSFAQVYKGFHKDSRALVAIKSVNLEKLNKKLKENLYGEIQILKTLRHPHIVALHDCIETSTHINLIMEFCELSDLSIFIRKRDRLVTNPVTHDMARKYPNPANSGLNEVIIRHFLKQLASALQFLRAKDCIHRDVKPQNLLLIPPPNHRNPNSPAVLAASSDSLVPVAGLPSLPMLKLADFGFARVLPSTSLADTLCGSPLYMAPEILRYERYDAKADLWSVGTVLYEMVTGRPPTRARNHVELLRKIEAAQDIIKFPKEAVVSSEMKALIGALLKRTPVERLSFDNFFSHSAVTSPIPGLVEDDMPSAAKPSERRPSGAGRIPPRLQDPSSRRSSRYAENDLQDSVGLSRSPREQQVMAPTKTSSPVEGRFGHLHSDSGATRLANAHAQDAGDGLGIRPRPHTMATAPARPSRLSESSGQLSGARPSSQQPMHEEEKVIAQDAEDRTDYVFIDQRQVEINAFADEMDAKRHLGPHGAAGNSRSPLSQALVSSKDRAYGLSTSPGSSASSAISKAIQDASVRLFGYRKFGNRFVKGHSPPMPSPFPLYPTPVAPAALIGDGRNVGSLDDDSRAAQTIEDLATRSDVVYGFAEVKFKQLFPSPPSVEHSLGLGGALSPEPMASSDEGLTPDAIVSLSEEAFVLYYKVLTILATAMDIANAWWTRKKAGDSNPPAPAVTQRINAVVQWVRTRFNEVLEKTELAQLKLVDGHKHLPEDHSSHPGNLGIEESISSVTSAGLKGFFLSPGLSAEKLMYDRALDMSRAAAIREISHNDLPGCEISYVTAIRMLEVVLDNDEDVLRRKISSKELRDESRDELSSSLDNSDKQSVRKLIQMINSRLATVRKKMLDIAESERSGQALQLASRRRSGDVTPRSVPSYTSF